MTGLELVAPCQQCRLMTSNIYALRMSYVVITLFLFALKLGLSLNDYYEVYNNLVLKAKICISNLIHSFQEPEYFYPCI